MISPSFQVPPLLQELLEEDSFLSLASRACGNLSDEQLAVFQALYEWRDGVCREEDESSGYILPRVQLIKLSQLMPSELNSSKVCFAFPHLACPACDQHSAHARVLALGLNSHS